MGCKATGNPSIGNLNPARKITFSPGTVEQLGELCSDVLEPLVV
jgi:hypothetical protein